MKVTFFESTTNTQPIKVEDVTYFLNRIKEGAVKKTIEHLRTLSKEDYNEQKKKLSGVCFTGVFSKRNAKDLKEHSGLIVLDFDKFSTTEAALEFKDELKKDLFIFSVWLSPSAKGLKVLVKIPKEPENHKLYFKALKEHFSSDFWDDSVSDVSRLCYESYDKDIYINEASQTWLKKAESKPYKAKEVNSSFYNSDEAAVKLKKWFDTKVYNPNERNASLFKLASAFNRFGIDQSTCERFALEYEQEDFNAKEILKVVNNAYSNTAEFNKEKFEDSTEDFYLMETKKQQIKEAASKGFKDIVLVDTETTLEDFTTCTINPLHFYESDLMQVLNLGAKKITLCLNDVSPVLQLCLKLDFEAVYISEDTKTKSINEAAPFYEWQLQNLINSFHSKELTAKETDELLLEIVKIGEAINSPLHRSRYKEHLVKNQVFTALGIEAEAYEAALDNLQVSKEAEQQKRELNKTLTKVQRLQSEGHTEEAVNELKNNISNIDLLNKQSLFKKNLTPLSRPEIAEALRQKGAPIKTGYNIEGTPLELPTGAVTIIAAPTSHGKTRFLNNIALNIATQHEGKKVLYFSYEEAAEAITVKALNTFCNMQLSSKNIPSIEAYLTGEPKYIKANALEDFEAKAEVFFNEFINTGRLTVNYCDYNAAELCSFIRYAHKYEDISAIIIDYIQIIAFAKDSKEKAYSRQDEISKICKAIKTVAVETGLPIVLAAQFNRDVKAPEDVETYHIREAADIEQVAALIIGMFDYNFAPERWEGKGENKTLKEWPKNTLLLKVLKNRNGKANVFTELTYIGNTGRIKTNIENEEDVPEQYKVKIPKKDDFDFTPEPIKPEPTKAPEAVQAELNLKHPEAKELKNPNPKELKNPELQ
jgi:replicative DNA helicase